MKKLESNGTFCGAGCALGMLAAGLVALLMAGPQSSSSWTPEKSISS
jgi:hypothetical protein